MTEEVVCSLPEVLKKYICTLKKASMDTTNKEPMCESSIKVVDFDKIPNEFARGKGWRGVPKSNDALYIDIKGIWHFIEFKNGNVYKDEVVRKIYDSIIMLVEWGIIPDYEFVRKNINYILVYNEGKHEKIQKSLSREQTYGYFMELAAEEEKLFEVDKLEGYLFNETHTYTQSLFEKHFILAREKEEGIIK
ncbi:MAG: hypothetical protein IKL49_09280 [Lachnospiraceae bacterium]|nr:hypothetical protein [Lachnospiraceae bacterium]